MSRFRRPDAYLTWKQLDYLAGRANGLTNAQIAEAAYVTEGTVKQTLARARHRIAENEPAFPTPSVETVIALAVDRRLLVRDEKGVFVPAEEDLRKTYAGSSQ